MQFFKPACFVWISLLCARTAFSQSTETPFYIEICRKGKPEDLLAYSSKFIADKDSATKAEGWYIFAYSHYNKGQMDSTIHYLDRARGYARNQSSGLQAEILNLMAISASRAQNYELTKKYTDQLLDLARASNDSLMIASAYSTWGITLKNKQQFTAAIENYTRAAEIYLALDHRLIVNQYSNIAIAYTLMQHDDMALKWFRKAYAESLKHDDRVLRHRACGNLGNWYKKTGALDSSLFYVRKALLYSNAPLDRSLDYQRMAEIFLKKKDLDSASHYIAEAGRSAANSDIPRRKVELLSIESQIRKAEGAFETALLLADSALQMCYTHDLTDKILQFTLLKTDIYENMQDYDKALKTLELHNRLKDSLVKAEDKGKIQKVVSEYALKEKKSEITAAQLENRARKTKIAILISVFVVAFIILLFFILRNRNRDESIPNTPKDQVIVLKSGQVLRCNELLYVKAEGNYLEYYPETGEASLLERNSLKACIEMLSGHGFIQVHRSYMVNPDKVSAVNRNLIRLDTGAEIPLSRTFKQKLKESGHPLFV